MNMKFYFNGDEFIPSKYEVNQFSVGQTEVKIEAPNLMVLTTSEYDLLLDTQRKYLELCDRYPLNVADGPEVNPEYKGPEVIKPAGNKVKTNHPSCAACTEICSGSAISVRCKSGLAADYKPKPHATINIDTSQAESSLEKVRDLIDRDLIDYVIRDYSNFNELVEESSRLWGPPAWLKDFDVYSVAGRRIGKTQATEDIMKQFERACGKMIHSCFAPKYSTVVPVNGSEWEVTAKKCNECFEKKINNDYTALVYGIFEREGLAWYDLPQHQHVKRLAEISGIEISRFKDFDPEEAFELIRQEGNEIAKSSIQLSNLRKMAESIFRMNEVIKDHVGSEFNLRIECTEDIAQKIVQLHMDITHEEALVYAAKVFDELMQE